MQDLSITLIQAELQWEDAEANLRQFDDIIASIDHSTDLILLPEMFNTGFSMNVDQCAEPPEGMTMKWLREKAAAKNCVVAGSVLTREGSAFFNRFVWMRPEGTYAHYDKRHLFSMAGEDKIMAAGQTRTIVGLKGWNISLQVCYDLRFPVWSRNNFRDGRHDYDVLIYVANWPEVRKEAYQRLLPARAIENQSYVVWVNRVGKDGRDIDHSGDSGVYDPMGNPSAMAKAGSREVLHVTLSADLLLQQRSRFRIGPDWDSFIIEK